ncbi:hypothetical protein LTR56_017928 [Elasticomyces elasticus]|nr:hypothetical protein LTR56_017928 [Elasticomyces elasticus]KAK3647221.1 hypothetical protein LTR22_013882 [Elasticomyces elasticus]KAK4913837.1 hypothetical protein LTR49_017873 [Elasticomyces elasticus]KAK5752920.1 hypothetical protein LTS12_016992 [Elasticomyces elasticus]
MLPDHTAKLDLSTATHSQLDLASSPAADLTFTTAERAVVLDHEFGKSLRERLSKRREDVSPPQVLRAKSSKASFASLKSTATTPTAAPRKQKRSWRNLFKPALTPTISPPATPAPPNTPAVTPKASQSSFRTILLRPKASISSSLRTLFSPKPEIAQVDGSADPEQQRGRPGAHGSINLADENDLEQAILDEGEGEVDGIQGCCEGFVSPWYDGAADGVAVGSGTVADRIRQLEERRRLTDATPTPSTTKTTAPARVNLAAGRERPIDGLYTRNAKAELHSPVAYLSGTKDKCVRHGRKPNDMLDKGRTGVYYPIGYTVRQQTEVTSPYLTSKSGYTDPCPDCRAELSIRRREAMHTVMRPALDDLVITQDLIGPLDAVIFESKGEIERVIINARLGKSTTEVLMKLSEDMLSISQALAGAGAGPTVSTSGRTRQEKTVVFDTVAGHKREYSMTELLELVDRAMETEPASAVLPPIAFHPSPYHHAPEAPRYGVTGC